MRYIPDGLLQQFLAGVADDGAELLVDAQEAARGVPVGDADRRVLERPAKPLLARAQRFLGLPEVGDVGAGPKPFGDVSFAIPDGRAAGLEPAVHAVRTADAVFHVVGAAARHRVGPESPGRLPVVRVQRRQPAPAQQVALGHSGVLGPLRAEVVTGAVGRGAPDELRQRLGQAPPTLLALPQPLLGLLPGGNVQVPPLDEAEGPVRGEHPVAARPDPADRAVLVPDAVLVIVHPPLPQGGEDCLAGGRPVLGQHEVVVIEPSGSKLFGRVAGHLFDALADEQDVPVLVGQGPIRRPRKDPHERVEQPLAFPQRLLGLPEVVDVLDGRVLRDVSTRPAVGVTHGTDRLVTNSYNDLCIPGSSHCEEARVTWPTCS